MARRSATSSFSRRDRSHRPLLFALLLLGLVVAARPAESSGASDPPDLSGKWAQKVVMTSLSEPPIIGTVTTWTTTYMYWEIRQQGRALELQPETCDVSVREDSSMVTTRLPDRFAEALPDRPRRGRITEEDGTTLLTIERSDRVLGARVREPRSETLPDSTDDARLVDADGDGHPGVTIEVEGIIDGSLYIVQRAWDRYRGRIESSSRIEGTIEWAMEQRVVDSTSVFLNSQPPTRPHPDASEQSFEMVRVDSDLDCRELLERADELFRDAP